MALLQQLLLLPAPRSPAARESSSKLSSAAHVGVGLELQIPQFLPCRAKGAYTFLGSRRSSSSHYSSSSHGFFRTRDNSVVVVSAGSVFTVQEDEETDGRPGRERDSRLSQGRFPPSSSGREQQQHQQQQHQRGGWSSGRAEDSGREVRNGDGRNGRGSNNYNTSSSPRGYAGGREFSGSDSRRGQGSSDSYGGDRGRRGSQTGSPFQRGYEGDRRSDSKRSSSRKQDSYGSAPGRNDGGRNDSRGDFRSNTQGWNETGSSAERNGSRGNVRMNSQGGNERGGYGGRNDSRGDARMNSQGGNARGGYGGRNDSRGDSRTSSNRRDDNLSRKNSSNPSALTITPRESVSPFVSDRAVYRAPWEQGTSSRSFQGRDFTQKNPLIERLQKMQKELEDDDDDEVEDEVEDDYDGSVGEGDIDDVESARFDRGGEKSAMARIVEKLSNIPGGRRIYEPKSGSTGPEDKLNPIFIPKYNKPMFPTIDRDWSTPDHPIPTPGAFPTKKARLDTRFPWEREDDASAIDNGTSETFKRVKPPSLAELTLPDEELKRLRSLGILTRHRIKVGKQGVTKGIVESIHNEWRNSEVVRVKCEGPPAQNMKRTHESLEEKTGGLVVWRAGGACLVYRGKDYVQPPLRGLEGDLELSTENAEEENGPSEEDNGTGEAEDEDEDNTKTKEKVVVVPRVNSIYDPELEREMEEILSTLGPRYEDWNGAKPVPVDGDLLLDPDFNFKKPYRLLPYGVKRSLSNLEMTNLRKLARPLPPHFVLGVNRGLSGLAGAIVKLWERSEIAKIAVKRGVQNTNHERMGEQLKRLTGGVVLSRDKYFIVLYRGKDFLPPSVAATLEERQFMAQTLQEEEEKARMFPKSTEVVETSVKESIAGTLSETLAAKANWERLQNTDEERKHRENALKTARRDKCRRIERKMAITLAKKKRAEVQLEKVEKGLSHAGPPRDRENITDEERHMYRKLGLKMHAFLLLGRRGVFDGTVENMHLHWKHRELVKIIFKARDKIELEQTARMLEYESGGILVATVPTSKGQAIIVYRGKNYQRPPELRPRNLLTKRQALKRSIEMQRQQALTRHLLELERHIESMRTDLSKLEEEEKEIADPVANSSGNEEETQDQEMQDLITFSEFQAPKRHSDLVKDSRLASERQSRNPDAIFRADPLSRREKLVLRQEALKGRKRAAHFNVGRSNIVAGLAKAIRIHFQKHALVKIGVKGRARGTPVEEILYQLEEATGGTLVSQENSKLIFYRGWPEGQEKPTEGNGHWEELSTEMRNAMIAEAEADEDYLHESDWDESGDEDEKLDEDDGGEEEEEDEDEDEDFFEAEGALDSAEVDDDSDWDDFDEDDDDDDRSELELDLGQDEDGLDEDEEGHDLDEDVENYRKDLVHQNL